MTTSEQRTATLTELVAQEIDAVRGRRRMSQAELARQMGKTPMWVSLRLRGQQPIDLNDMLLFARVLGVDVHDLMPSRETAATAATARPVDRSVNAPYRSGNRSVDVSPIASPAYGPFGGGRHDSVRPVSAVPGTRKRPRRLR